MRWQRIHKPQHSSALTHRPLPNLMSLQVDMAGFNPRFVGRWTWIAYFRKVRGLRICQTGSVSDPNTVDLLFNILME